MGKKWQARVTEGTGVVVEAWEDGAFLPEDGSPVIGEFEDEDEALAAAEEAAEAARRFQEGDRDEGAAAQFLNLTPHAIVLGGHTIPPSGDVARVATVETHVDDLDVGAGSVPVITVQWGGIEGVPADVDPRTMVLVSGYVAGAIEAGAACPVATVYVPDRFIRDAAGRIVGASALRRVDRPAKGGAA